MGRTLKFTKLRCGARLTPFTCIMAQQYGMKVLSESVPENRVGPWAVPVRFT